MKNESLEQVISVSGSAELEVAPDQAEFVFSIVTDRKNVNAAQKENRDVSYQVLNALRAIGIQEKQVETVRYSVSKTGSWEGKKYVEKGHQVVNSYKLQTKDLGLTGLFIDTVVKAGANNVGNIAFSLSDELKEKTKTELLTKACKDARSKAELLASTLGVGVGRPTYISEGEQQVGRQFYARAASLEAMDSGERNTQIQAQNVQTSAQVSVSFEIKYN